MHEVALGNQLIVPVEAPLEVPRKKIGIVVPVLAYFKGLADLCLSISTQHEYRIYIQPQYIGQVSLSEAWNHGCDQAWADGCDYALVCNDDILFAPDAIDQLVSEYERLRSEAVIMVTPNNILGHLPGGQYDILHYPPFEGVGAISDHPNFSCFLVAPEYFETVGRFDQNFYPAYYEDNDSHGRATLLGLREICTTAASIVHIGGATSRLIPPNSGESQRYYIEKWGGVPSSHMNDLPKEHFPTPYNDPTLTVRDWRGQA